MEKSKRRSELHLVSHLIVLITMACFSALLIFLNRALKWDAWMIPVIIAGTVICWMLHILHRMPERSQTYICGMFLVLLTFYYMVNIDTRNDSTGPVIILIFVFALQEENILTASEVIAGHLGTVSHIFLMHELGTGLDTVHAIRLAWQLLLLPLAAVLANRIAEAWKNAEKEYQGRIDEVAAENNRVNNFLSNVSHEIRTPINAVIGLSAVLEKAELPESLLWNVDAISNAGHRVAEQIEDLLDFTEIDMENLDVSREHYMINSLVNDLLSQLSFAENYGLDLVIDLDAGVPSALVGDGGKIRKILWHLIANGYKFTREGGVYVHIYPIHREYGINLVMEVRDTGTGMTQEQIEHTFEKFYRSDSGRSGSAGGLGLGLSIANGFTKAMGGVLVIESTPQSGTLVRVSIPQQVEDDSPCISIGDRESCAAAGFLSFMTTGHPRIREYYMEMISHLVSGLSVSFHRVQSRRELENLLASVKISHLFVGTGEYLENREYIDRLAGEINVAVVVDQGFSGQIGGRVARLPKPFYGAQVTNFLNQSFGGPEGDEKERMTCPGVKALVVDDEPMNLLVARGILEDYEMDVTTVASGMEAITICGREDFDIIFIDHMMPEMDGIEAMKRLRLNAARERKELCIVALTANAIRAAKEMFLAEGFDAFVPKPIDISELERVLRRLLPKQAVAWQKEEGPKKPPEAVRPRDRFEALAGRGVDVGYGLGLCRNDREFYREILQEYARDSARKLEALEQAYAGGRWKDYSIRVHAVKSTSKQIGALELSDTARLLEEASKAENEAEVQKLHPGFLPRYRQLMETIRELFGQAPDEPDDEILEFEPEDGEEFRGAEGI